MHFLYNIMLPFPHFSVLQLDGERWNCPFGSSPSCSDYAYKAGWKVGEVNRGQAVLQAVKQLCVWLKTTSSWNVNIPAGSHHALSPHCFTGGHDGPVGGSWVKMEEKQIVSWHSKNVESCICAGPPKGVWFWEVGDIVVNIYTKYKQKHFNW